MKRIILLITGFLILTNLFRQSDFQMVLDSTYTFGWHTSINEWVGRVLSAYMHDANGNQTEETHYLCGVSNS